MFLEYDLFKQRQAEINRRNEQRRQLAELDENRDTFASGKRRRRKR